MVSRFEVSGFLVRGVGLGISVGVGGVGVSRYGVSGSGFSSSEVSRTEFPGLGFPGPGLIIRDFGFGVF